MFLSPSRKILASAVFLYSENFLRVLYSVFLLVALRQILATETFAVFAFYLTISLMLYSVSKFSLDTVAVKYLVRDKSKKGTKELIARLAIFRFLVGIIVTVLAFFILKALGKLDPVVFLIIVAQLLRVPDSLEWYLRSSGMFNIQSIARIFSLSLPVSIMFVTFIGQYKFSDDRYFALIICLEWVSISTIYSIYYIQKFGMPRIYNPIGGMARSVVSVAAPVLLAQIVSLIYLRVDQLVLESYLPSYLYSQYIVAARINDAFLVVVLTMNMMIVPNLVALKDKDEFQYKNKLRFYSRIFFLLSLAVTASIWLLDGVFRYFDFNVVADYMGAEFLGILKMLVLSTVINFYFGLRSSFYVIEGWSRNVFYGAIVGCSFGVLVGIPLMKNYGVEGGVFSVVYSAFLALFVTDLFSKRGRAFIGVLFNGGGSRGS